MADLEINGTILKILKEYYTDTVTMSKLVINYQYQLKLQKTLDNFIYYLSGKNSGSLEEELPRNGNSS